MAQNGAASPPVAQSISGEDEATMSAPRKLKILMLHGYTQTGPLFHAKTRALEKILHKAFPPSSPKIKLPLHDKYPGGISLTYPTAPLKLLPADIPGFNPSENGEEKEDVYGWWKRETGSGNYIGLEQGLDTIADSIRSINGIDAVIGFSQGAAAAGMVASLLEPGRTSTFSKYISTHPEAFAYPERWKGLSRMCNEGKGLLFAVSYSGFLTPNELYGAFYEPKIKTRVLHVIGSLDGVVEEERSLAFVRVCERGRTVYHPGGHFVPIGKEMAGVLVGFVKECLQPKKKEGGVEDMDVPF